MKKSNTKETEPSYENTLAEGVNGILKTGLIYNECIYENFEQLQARIAQITSIYNTQRPHFNCGFFHSRKSSFTRR